MTRRLPTGILASALIRRVNDVGGFATVRARGDAQAGSMLLVLAERGCSIRMVERGIGPNGAAILIDSTPNDDPELYWQRRRAGDPDLWVIELDVADAERFAAETILDD